MPERVPALSAEIRAICRLSARAGVNKGTFEPEPVNMPGTGKTSISKY